LLTKTAKLTGGIINKEGGKERKRNKKQKKRSSAWKKEVAAPEKLSKLISGRARR